MIVQHGIGSSRHQMALFSNFCTNRNVYFNWKVSSYDQTCKKKKKKKELSFAPDGAQMLNVESQVRIYRFIIVMNLYVQCRVLQINTRH